MVSEQAAEGEQQCDKQCEQQCDTQYDKQCDKPTSCMTLLAESVDRALREVRVVCISVCVVHTRCDSCVVRTCASRHTRLYTVCCCFLLLSSDSPV